MQLCFPVESDQGLDSNVFGHFGSAPFFIIVNSDTGTIETINNGDLGHTHGMCNPLKALDGRSVDGIIVGGIGGGAVNKLNASGVKVYRATAGSVQANMELFKDGTMPELTAEHACGGHSHNGGCGH